MPFKDSAGIRGRPKTTITTEEKRFTVKATDTHYIVDFSQSQSKKLKVTKSNMERLARWILSDK